jgi:hypothetical protein
MTHLTYDESVEARIKGLEAKIEQQNKQLQILASVSLLSKSSRLDTPINQFFKDADAFLDVFYPTNVPCHNSCTRRYRAAIEAAGNNLEKIQQARENVAACRAECGNILQ